MIIGVSDNCHLTADIFEVKQDMCYKLHTHILEGCTNSLTKVYNCDIYSFVFMSKNISCR